MGHPQLFPETLHFFIKRANLPPALLSLSPLANIYTHDEKQLSNLHVLFENENRKRSPHKVSILLKLIFFLVLRLT